jgi:hypothetical protein
MDGGPVFQPPATVEPALISASLVMTGFFLTLRHAGWHLGAATGG